MHKKMEINAVREKYAYAQGFTGKSTDTGICDKAFFFYPESGNSLNAVNCYRQRDCCQTKFSASITAGIHSAHVTGIIAKERSKIDQFFNFHQSDINLNKSIMLRITLYFAEFLSSIWDYRQISFLAKIKISFLLY